MKIKFNEDIRDNDIKKLIFDSKMHLNSSEDTIYSQQRLKRILASS